MSGRALIVGGGIIGLMSAHQLLKRGFQVTVLEREGRERSGSSYGNAGLIVPSHFVPLAAPGVVAQGIRWMANPRSPFYVKPRLDPALLGWGWRFFRAGTEVRVRESAPVLLELNLASRDMYVEINEALGGGFEFERLGVTMLANTERGLEGEARTAEHARELGLKVRVLDAAGVAALEPDIDLNVVGGVHYADDAHLDPGALMRALEGQLERAGVEIRHGVNVVGFESSAGRVASVIAQTETAEAEKIPTDTVILAAGAWSGELARSVGLRLPMQPGKGYSLTLEAPSQRLNAPAILSEARAAVTRMGERLRVGGTMELAGFDASANEARIEGILDSVRCYFPGLSHEELTAPPRWHGFRPCSPDGLPYVGRSPRHENLIIATGHLMMGVSLAPITGRIVSELAANEAPSLDITRLRVDRYG